jgi:REP element-mobilizing transposase RayT
MNCLIHITHEKPDLIYTLEFLSWQVFGEKRRRGWCPERSEGSSTSRTTYSLPWQLLMPVFITDYPQFFTATIQGWKKLLQPDKYKEIIINSLRFLVEDKRINLYAFVIMSNHIHLIWQMQALIHPEHVQRDFLKYTAQRIKHNLKKNHPPVLAHFKSDANDRSYQFWKRRPLSIELRTDMVYRQKLDYIH